MALRSSSLTAGSRTGAPAAAEPCSRATTLVFSLRPTRSPTVWSRKNSFPAHHREAVAPSRKSRPLISARKPPGRNSVSSSSRRTGSHSGSPAGKAIITAPRTLSAFSCSPREVSARPAAAAPRPPHAAAPSAPVRSSTSTRPGAGAAPVRLPSGSAQ